jgi:catechol 2,3-dioxygenase-like lactoylglutathione lyase family enzyme
MRPLITFVTLGVSDVRRSRSFYEKLGFKASKASSAEVAFFDANGLVLALFGHDDLAADAGIATAPMPAYRGVSLAWNATSEADADAIMAHARACGARVVKQPHKVFWGGYSGYFADPDGHLWEVAFNPFFPFDEADRIKLP